MSENNSIKVFVSSTYEDLEFARHLVAKLLVNDFLACAVEPKCENEEIQAERTREALDSAASCLLLFGPSGKPPWGAETVLLIIDEWEARSDEGYRLIPVSLPGGPDALPPDLPNTESLRRLRQRPGVFVKFKEDLDEEEATHKLILLLRGVDPDEQPLWAQDEFQHYINRRARNAFDVNWSKFATEARSVSPHTGEQGSRGLLTSEELAAELTWLSLLSDETMFTPRLPVNIAYGESSQQPDFSASFEAEPESLERGFSEVIACHESTEEMLGHPEFMRRGRLICRTLLLNRPDAKDLYVDAEELYQEVCFEIWHSAKNSSRVYGTGDVGNFSRWFWQVARNTLLDRSRKHGAARHVPSFNSEDAARYSWSTSRAQAYAQEIERSLSAEQEAALAFLYADPEVNRELGRIAFRFRQDRDDLRQEIALRLSTDGHVLRDIKCLKSWCYVTATNICRNNYRHEKVVRRHGERCAGESVQCKRGGGAVIVQHSEVKTPEQEMLDQELEALREDRVSELCARLGEIVNSLPKDVQVIARLWVEGRSLMEIANIIGKSVKTVYRKHKEFQMEIVQFKRQFGHDGERPDYDLVCLSHLRWDFVYQRPQHLLSRCARDRRVFYFEEPHYGDGLRLDVRQSEEGVYVAVPHLPEGVRGKREAEEALLQSLLAHLFAEYRVREHVLWYYTPMPVAWTRHLRPLGVVYDCMDELSAFKFAPAELVEREAELFRRSDLVFTGGQSLYEAKRGRAQHVYAFPSGIDREHFGRARQVTTEPEDQAGIPHPRLGFFGVVDERFDLELLDSLSRERPDWHFVIIGPVIKIDPDNLPRGANVHYLGGKSYKDLPAYLAGWDVATLLFARNEHTRYISPTKTPEYLAAGKPVISTSIRDVVRPYGELGLVRIADDAPSFAAAAEELMRAGADADWLARVDALLAQNTWDRMWARMSELIEGVAGRRLEVRASRSLSRPVDGQVMYSAKNIAS